MRRVIDIFVDLDCEVICLIRVDYNFIEVNVGYCWFIKERCFLESFILEEKVGLVMLCVFLKYDF